MAMWIVYPAIKLSLSTLWQYQLSSNGSAINACKFARIAYSHWASPNWFLCFPASDRYFFILCPSLAISQNDKVVCWWWSSSGVKHRCSTTREKGLLGGSLTAHVLQSISCLQGFCVRICIKCSVSVKFQYQKNFCIAVAMPFLTQMSGIFLFKKDNYTALFMLA